MMLKKHKKKQQKPIILQQYLISIDARLRSRKSTVSVKAETAECLVARDLIIAWCLYNRIETFPAHFE